MAISTEYYGSISEANDYFAMVLHQRAWSLSNNDDRARALYAATLVIDTLNFKGQKHSVYQLLLANPQYLSPITAADRLAAQAAIRAADVAQELEFPRGADTEVPEAIRRSCYEIALSLLDGKDPEVELETLGIVSQGYGSVRTTYNRAQVPIEHLINGVPAAKAWRWLRPFLRDDDAIKLSRVS